MARRYCLSLPFQVHFSRMCLAFWRVGLAVRVYLTIPLPGALPVDGGRRTRAAVRLIENRSSQWMRRRSKLSPAHGVLPIRAFPNENSTRVAVEFSCGKLVSSRRVRIASNEATRADVYFDWTWTVSLYVYRDRFIQKQCFIAIPLHRAYIYRLQLIISLTYRSINLLNLYHGKK